MLEYHNILYCLMNNNFEFIDKYDNITDSIAEAAGYQTLAEAKAYRDECDEPNEWKIVKKSVDMTLDELIEEED